jgi:hypothetical protein
MQGNKPFTNVNFTKRVDHDKGGHREPRAEQEPAVCERCHSILLRRRWVSASRADRLRLEQWRAPHATVCPACKQVEENLPRGFLAVDGVFAADHCVEVEDLLRNVAARAADTNALARVMQWERGGHHVLMLATTTEQLAQRLGHALEATWGGSVSYKYSHENKLTRVSWRRN